MALLRFPFLEKPPFHSLQTCINGLVSLHPYRLINSIKRMSGCARLGAIGSERRATVPDMNGILSDGIHVKG
jgi:hypothetical protein